MESEYNDPTLPDPTHCASYSDLLPPTLMKNTFSFVPTQIGSNSQAQWTIQHCK